MKKSSSIIVLILTLLVSLGLAYLVFFGINTADTEKLYSAYNIKKGLDLEGGVSITYQVVGEENPSQAEMDDTIAKLQRRVEYYSTEAHAYQEGTNRINIEIPGISDAETVLSDLGRPGQLYFISEKDDEGNLNYSLYKDEEGNSYVDQYGQFVYVPMKDIATMIADGSVALVGTDVADAQPGSQQSDLLNNSQYVVSLRFTDAGADKFYNMTSRAASRGETIGIYYDGEFISVASCNTAIAGGKAVIQGSFTYEEVEKLATQIRIGGLKLELEELRSNVVGAQLGSKAIETSLLAGLIGFIIIAIFMIAVYRIPGLAATIALAIYTLATVLLISMFDITLTLPGIAGIVLSIGMAVDANVIIFARIREEIATGKTVESSINLGFKKALSAILDGNITTLIAAAVLGAMGTGAIKGFAATLALGIIVSVVTAVFVTKGILKALFGIGFKNMKFYGVSKPGKKFDYVGNRKKFLIISGAVIAAGIIMLCINAGVRDHALNFSMDFVGGTATTADLNADYSIEELEQSLEPEIAVITGNHDIQIQNVTGSTEYIIKTSSLNSDQRIRLTELLSDKYGTMDSQITIETISSTISSEMTRSALIAVLIATICMLIYIWIRFSDFRFGGAAVICLLHDVLIVTAFYAFAWVSVSSTFVACMLTIVGYSINATIVIFDRIREVKAELSRKDQIADAINSSITQTMSRSIFTSLTTFVMVAVLYILGVASIREFALPLMIGIICGTYSSVCLAGPIYEFFRKKFGEKKKEAWRP